MQTHSIRKRLNIPGYKITSILLEREEEIHIRIEPYKRKGFICSGCGKNHKVGYHGLEESVAEDLSLFEKRVYLHVVKRRYVCPVDQRSHIEDIPWLKKHSR